MLHLPLGWVDVNVVSIGTTEVEPRSQKRLDAAMTFLLNEVAQMKSLGYDVETLAASDALADPDAAFIRERGTPAWPEHALIDW